MTETPGFVVDCSSEQRPLSAIEAHQVPPTEGGPLQPPTEGGPLQAPAEGRSPPLLLPAKGGGLYKQPS